MGTSDKDLDAFVNSLARKLGGDTAALLSAWETARPMLAPDALAQYAATLFGFFVGGFVAGLSKQAMSAAADLGKKLAARLGESLRKLQKPGQASPPERREALADADAALREAAARPELAAACESATLEGTAQVAAQLELLGMEREEAEEKARQLVQTIVARMREP